MLQLIVRGAVIVSHSRTEDCRDDGLHCDRSRFSATTPFCDHDPAMRLAESAISLPRGNTESIIVLSAPTPELALATLSAVRQWRFSPTYVDGQAVEVVTTDVLFHSR
jgi:hypothetical protein